MKILDVSKWLTDMASADFAVREKAGGVVSQIQPDAAAAVLHGLADIMGGTEPSAAKSAKLAMERYVHQCLGPHPGKDRPDGKVRSAVAESLQTIVASARPRLVRAHALLLLGFAGDHRDEKSLTAMLTDAELGPNARMTVQRIRSNRY
jgi:hypothetical protein